MIWKRRKRITCELRKVTRVRILSFLILVACTFIADARAGRRPNFGGGELSQGPLGTRFKEYLALSPRTCSPHSPLHGNDEKEERRMRVHAIRPSIRLPLPAAAGEQAMVSRGQKEPRA